MTKHKMSKKNSDDPVGEIVIMFYYGGGWVSAVGIMTPYWLDGPRIESRWWGRNFLHPSRQALGHTQPPIQWVPGLFWG